MGFGGDDAPLVEFSSVVGRRRMNTHIPSTMNSYFVGDDATIRRGILDLNHPIENGLVNNWNDLEDMWRFGFDRLLQGKDLSDRNVLVLDSVSSSCRSQRTRFIHTLFETFSVGGMRLEPSALMALYGNGKLW